LLPSTHDHSGSASEMPEASDLYDVLRDLAESYLARERQGHTLQPTALVHEAFLRLAETGARLNDDDAFRALAATVMRRVLVDSARARRARKRGGGWSRVSLEGVVDHARPGPDVLELDEALRALADEHARAARVVELRFYGGLGVEPVATLLGVSPRTVELDWSFARAWLLRRLGEGAP